MIRYLLAFVLLVAGCQKNDFSRKTETIRINIDSDPTTLDPRKARSLTSVTVLRMFFEGLTRISKTGRLEMALAEHVDQSDDGLHYTFHLRKALWSNGDPVTSFDFAESWRTILDPHFPTDIAYQLYGIKNARKAKLGETSLDQVGVRTPDPQTLIVELEQPIPYFLELVSMSSFLPVPYKVVNGNSNWSNDPKSYVCNGPFILESWKHSDQIRAVKNRHYWQAKDIHLAAIDLLMMSNDTEIQMFEEGKLDWAGSPLSTIPIDAVQALKSANQLKVSPFSATYFFRVNTSDQVREKNNPLANPSFRKALSFALQREQITAHILQGGQIPAKALVPPEMDLSEKGYFHDADLERSHALLMDALLELNLSIDQLEPIKISYANDPRNAVIAQAVQKQWEEGLQIKVELEVLEPKTFFQRLSQKDFQLAAGSWTADFNDAVNFLEVFKYKEASTNNTNWESSKYISLLNQSNLCRNLEERRQILREAEQILMDQMPIIPIFHFALNYLQNDALNGVALSPLGQIDFRWVELKN